MPLPKITLTGTAVADPEMRFTPAGKAVATIRVATNDRHRGQNGEWTDGPTTYLDVEVWERTAENVVETITKGTKIIAEGRLEVSEFEKRDGGGKGIRVKVKADTIGPSLQFDTYSKGEGATRAAAPAADPWATPSAGGDEPPPF